MKNSIFLLWLEGIDPSILSTFSVLKKLIAGGVDLALTPLPLVEKDVCYYQTITGVGSAKFGHFDSVKVEKYLVSKNTEEPDGLSRYALPNVLSTRKIPIAFVLVKGREEIKMFIDRANEFTIVRVLQAGSLATKEIEAIVADCIQVASPDAHIAILTDTWIPAAYRWVNVNNFLAEVGLLEAGSAPSNAQIVWPETLAYGVGTGQIWINLRGREPQGVVSTKNEYQEVCAALINELSTKWLDPQTQQSVVKHVWRKDEVYTGDYLFKAPDLVIEYQPGYIPSSKAALLDFDKTSIVIPTEAGTSPLAAYARLIASGPSLASGIKVTARSIDVIPNVLYLLGQAIPSYLDGEVMLSLFTPSYQQTVPLKYMESDTNVLSDDEEDMIVDRLRDLGYL